MKKKRILSLILCLSLFCTLFVPASTAYADNPPSDSGMRYSKTATRNDDGSYTITLEAFATGSQQTTTQTKDVPTDIILVLDQSGSMKDPMGRVTYSEYKPKNSNNSDNYDRRHNGGNANLWYKLDDNSYVSVSVTKTQKYRSLSSDTENSTYYSYKNNLYEKVGDSYEKVTLTRSWDILSYTYTYKFSDGTTITSEGGSRTPNLGAHAPLYTPAADDANTVYTYTYTDAAGTIQTIGTSTGAATQYAPPFYKRSISTNGGGSRLDALKSAVTNFSNTVATKAMGVDGIAGTSDDVNHRIAVVGYASRYDSNKKWKNTEVFVGANQYNYSENASQYYGSAFQNMSTTEGKHNITASIGALDADGATYTNYGLEMANGILNANPVPNGETRNRVIVLFTDGYPGKNADDFNSAAANAALEQATTAKNNGVSLYSVGIFSGADATTAGDYNGSNTDAANWFMQQVSSNNGAPRRPSYYLSAGDADSLNSIFQQISNNITTGGSSTTLGSETVIKDIISPYFKLPAGASASDITLKTYACIGKTGDTYTWDSTSGGSDGASATVSGDQVSVTGFNFSENWCGTETGTDGGVTYRGKKLVITFTVDPKPGFLGGNGVPTNDNAGVYENGSATTPVITFEKPTVDVPIQDVTVTAQDKNVYLLGGVTAEQLKTGAVVEVGGIELALNEPNYGLQDWQTAFVDITVAVKDKDGNAIPSGGLNNLTDDTTYTIEVTVAPKYDATTENTKSGTDTKNINVFKPELTFKDSVGYYGADVPELSGNLTKTEWKHGTTLDTAVTMIGAKPELGFTYTPEAGKIDNNKINTKQDIGVDVAVKIGNADVTNQTTFLHTACTGQTCTLPDGMKFLIHVKTCTLTITKSGGADNESYVFDVYKDGTKYSEVTIEGNTSQTLYELPVGQYTIVEDIGWSWRYNADNGTGVTLSAEAPAGEITCTNKSNGKNYWLNGFSQVVRNIFGVSH